jgi:hypothetical protein
MDGQLEAMDQVLEAANEMNLILQQPVPPPAPGAKEGDPDDAQSMVDDSEIHCWTRWILGHLLLALPRVVVVLTSQLIVLCSYSYR